MADRLLCRNHHGDRVVPQFEISLTADLAKSLRTTRRWLLSMRSITTSPESTRLCGSLRAMAAGLSERVWNLEEIVAMADTYMPKPAKRGPYKKRV